MSLNFEIIDIFIGCMPASTDKLCPRSLRSGLSALGSGGRRFEEGSHFCFMYLKKVYYEGIQVISVRAHDLLVGGGVGWLKSGLARGPDGSQFRA